MLKKTRICISVVVFFLFVYIFTDIKRAGTGLSEVLTHTQFFPLFIKGFFSGSAAAIILFIVILALTMIFGRVYCSYLCPLGILQDVFIFLRYRFGRKKRFVFSKGFGSVRYVVLFVVVAPFFAGSMFLLNALEPFSNFGRIASNIFNPLLLYISPFFGSNMHGVTAGVFFYTLGFFVFLGMLSFFKGRFFCNTLCPAGAILGLLSKKQKFRFVFNSETCNNCGICSNVCKAECLDHGNREVDTERCIGCFNCISACPKGSISFEPAGRETDKDRRGVIKTIAKAGAVIGASAFIPSLLKTSGPGKYPAIPPGAKDLNNFISKCTACHLCVASCPQKVLSVSVFDYGLNGIIQPKMDFGLSYCLYDCTVCSEVCPTGAIEKLAKKDKKVTQIGIASIDRKKCIPYYSGNTCSVCTEHCPTKAVYSVYHRGRLAPVVNADICIGCGACEHVCPSEKGKAIIITPLAQHKKALDASKAERPRYWRDTDKQNSGNSGRRRRRGSAAKDDFPF